jgi:hypothetical protein
MIGSEVDAGFISPLCGGESEFLALAKPSLRIRKRGDRCATSRRTATASTHGPCAPTPPRRKTCCGRHCAGTSSRQYPLDGYILDFVCFRPKLIVEVDGGQHADSEADARRDAHFRENGFMVLRFWNDDVIRNLDGACREILMAGGRGGDRRG